MTSIHPDAKLRALMFFAMFLRAAALAQATHAADLMREGGDIAGLFVVPRSMPLQRVLEDLELMISCSENDEWLNVIRYLPF